MSSTINIRESELPALYVAANNASEKAQRRYLRLFKTNLAVLICGTVCSSLAFFTDLTPILAILSGFLFVTGLIISAAVGVKRYEKNWYGGRAIAESVKTIAWRYMTRAEPYDSTLTARQVDEKLAKDLRDVLSERSYLSGALDSDLSNSPQVTGRMRQVRSLPTAERKDFYLTARIGDQRDWYGKQAKTNQDNELKWFFVIILAQLLAAASAFLFVRWPESGLRLTGVFSVFATASIAFLQVKRYQELAQAYNLAAQELGVIAVTAHHITTDEELSKFVGDAESAISREHIMWVARRDQT